MTTFQMNDTVGTIVRDFPALSRLFEQAQVDYCCGGKKTLAEACRQRGIDPKTFLAQLEDFATTETAPTTDLAALSLTELADHIQQVHHTYLHTELPRLEAMLDALHTFEQDMHQHVHKENNLLFPQAIALEQEKGYG
jgi:regulator of cell morphogenesis and NO signaling